MFLLIPLILYSPPPLAFRKRPGHGGIFRDLTLFCVLLCSQNLLAEHGERGAKAGRSGETTNGVS